MIRRCILSPLSRARFKTVPNVLNLNCAAGYSSFHFKVKPFHLRRQGSQQLTNYISQPFSVHTKHAALIERMKSESTASLKMSKIDTPAFKEIFTPELEFMIALFNKYNYELRIAGGAVRDLLSGKIPHDIDFATTATPEQMKTMFQTEGIRMLNMKGESHGTITCRINDKENFEVTTLRIDVVTDGRRAEVAFTKDWELDALRRDLTINSMFLGLDGTVYDYFNGSEDLNNRKIRFVGKAEQRIQEDYLRILRYFRFYGRIAEFENNHDPDTLKIIAENLDGMKNISGERIWTEMKKILEGRFAAPILKVMLELNMGKYLGLPSKGDIAEMEKIYEQGKDLNLKPMTILTALLQSEEELTTLHGRVKMSREELRLGLFLLTHRNDDMSGDVLIYCKNLLCNTKEPKTREKIIELMKYCNKPEVIEKFAEWKEPKFPVNGVKLLEAGVPKGPPLAKVLDALRTEWMNSEYTATEDELMAKVNGIVESLNLKK